MDKIEKWTKIGHTFFVIGMNGGAILPLFILSYYFYFVALGNDSFLLFNYMK